MTAVHLRLAARAASAWSDAVTFEKDVALRKAALILARESRDLQLAVPSIVEKAQELSRDQLGAAVERAPAKYREAIRTLAGCLLAEGDESEASIELAFSILAIDVRRSRP